MAVGTWPARTASSCEPAGANSLPEYSSAERISTIVASVFFETTSLTSATHRVALVDQDKIGLGLTVFVSIESSDHSEKWLKTFASAVRAMPEVMELYRMAGDVDYLLRVVVADMQSYDAFYKRLIAAVPLKNVSSRFAMEKIKSSTALPIPNIHSEEPLGGERDAVNF